MTSIPNPEALVEILSAEGAPPWIMLDLDGSDTPETGIVYVGLDAAGKLLEVQP